MSKELTKCAKAPCKSCPYRRDVPSGVWHSSEYDKLPAYDGEVMEQFSKRATGLFMCHQQDGWRCGCTAVPSIHRCGITRARCRCSRRAQKLPLTAGALSNGREPMPSVSWGGCCANVLLDEVTLLMR